MKNIQQEVKNALKLLSGIKFKEYKLDTVGIGTKDSNEYDQLCTDILKISGDSKEDEFGLIAKLNEPIEEISIVRIRKPVKPNYVGIVAIDFHQAMTAYPAAKVTEGEGWKYIQIEGDNGDIYISSVSEIGFYFPEPQSSDKGQESIIDQGELTKVKAELDLEKNRRISLMADFQNFQRRVDQEKATWGAMSNMSLIKDLLEIYDDLQLAMQDENLNLEHSKAAIISAQDKLVDSAKRAGIEKVEVKVGDEFDKEKMEAVSMVPVQDETQKGKVIAVISSAYKYANKDFILKAAKVVVGK